jgi:hypothetical protein
MIGIAVVRMPPSDMRMIPESWTFPSQSQHGPLVSSRPANRAVTFRSASSVVMSYHLLDGRADVLARPADHVAVGRPAEREVKEHDIRMEVDGMGEGSFSRPGPVDFVAPGLEQGAKGVAAIGRLRR